MKPNRAVLASLFGTAAIVVSSLLWHSAAAARTASTLDPQAVPPPAPATSLDRPPAESPVPLNPESDVEHCAACRLAAGTTGQLAPGSFELRPEVLEDGVSLRITSNDRAVRDALWKATLARGELLEALRTGAPVQLCSECRARVAMLTELKIVAHRIPEGMVLVYTSEREDVVRHIHAIVQATHEVPVQF
jgi:hypothetical protein